MARKINREKLDDDRYKFYGVAKYSAGGQPGDDNLKDYNEGVNVRNLPIFQF